MLTLMPSRDATYLDDSTDNYTPDADHCEHCAEVVAVPGACDDCRSIVDAKRYCTQQAEAHERQAKFREERADQETGWRRDEQRALADSERALARSYIAKRRGYAEQLSDRVEQQELCRKLEASLHVVREVQAAE